MTYTERAKELLALPCLGHMHYSADGDEYECDYEASCRCEDCVINFEKLGGTVDPRTDRPTPKRVVEIMGRQLRRLREEQRKKGGSSVTFESDALFVVGR